MIDRSTARSLTAASGTRGAVALVIIMVAPIVLAGAALHYYALAAQASAGGGFAMWDTFRISVHDIAPNVEYRVSGARLIAREYLYQALFFSFFAGIAGLGAANHWLLRARDRRIAALLRDNDLM